MQKLGGKKGKKGKKLGEVVRELEFKDENTEYGQIIRLLGDSRLEILCADGSTRMGHIRGKLKKKVYMNMNDIVLVSLREYEEEKCDVILKYTEDEVRKLKIAKEIPDNFKLTSGEKENEGYTNEENDVLVFSKKKPDEDNDEEDDKDDVVEEQPYNPDIDFDEENEDGKEQAEEEEDEEEEVVEVKYSKGKKSLGKNKRQNGQDRKKLVEGL